MSGPINPVANLAMQVDLSQQPVTLQALPLPTPSGISPVHLKLSVSKTGMWSGPIKYALETDSNGRVIRLEALEAVNVASAHLLERAVSGHTRWAALDASDVAAPMNFESDCVFDGSFQLLASYDAGRANSELGVAELGSHVLRLAAMMLTLSQGASVADTFGADRDVVAQQLASSIADAVAMALGQQASQNTILQTLLRANGPVLQLDGTPNASRQLQLVYSNAFTGLDVHLVLVNVPIRVTYYGVEKQLLIRQLPLCLSLV